MAKSLNKVLLIGHLGRDPEMKYTSGGMAITSFSIATSTNKKNKQTGEWEEQTEWHNIKAFDKLAASAAERLHKGSLVHLEGKIQTESWIDKNTSDKKEKKVIIANSLVFLDKAEKKDTAPVAQWGNGVGVPSQTISGISVPVADPQTSFADAMEITDADIPF